MYMIDETIRAMVRAGCEVVVTDNPKQVNAITKDGAVHSYYTNGTLIIRSPTGGQFIDKGRDFETFIRYLLSEKTRNGVIERTIMPLSMYEQKEKAKEIFG